MRVRLGRPADIPAIVSVEKSAGALFVGTHMDWAVGETSSPDDLAASIEEQNLWVAEDHGAVAGYLCGEPLDGNFYIEEISVAVTFQRRGVGRLLIDVVSDEARMRGFSALTLTTDRTLPWNAPYYRRIGFRILDAEDVNPSLARELASTPNPQLRCAMLRAL